MKNLIVGIDGTDTSRAALHWAAQTVGKSGRIHAVTAVNPWTDSALGMITGDDEGYCDSVGAALFDEWAAEVVDEVGEVVATVTSRPLVEALDSIVDEDAADAIVLGRHSGLAVLGAAVRRVGRSTNRLLRMTQHPVIVVPDTDPPKLDGGNVVVGIGHGDATRSAVRWAAQLARRRSVGIELLHATDDSPIFQATGVLDLARYQFSGAGQMDWRVGQVEHFAELMLALTGPELDLAISTPPGLAALRLDEASERSSLLVIGRHRSRFDAGHHSAQPLRHALTHARCPVVVVPDHPIEDFGMFDGVAGDTNFARLRR